MNFRKHHAAGQGIVGTDKLSSVYTREIFFQVDPATLDYMDAQSLRDACPRGVYINFDPEPFLKLLPELEAEIFWLVNIKKKNQKDVAQLLGLSQPTVSYRYRRTLEKLNYLMVLSNVPVKEMLEELDFLKPHEREVLYDLFFWVNQEMVGKKHSMRQSSVKWIFVKTKRNIDERERQDPEKYFHHLGLLLLLEKNLGIRVQQ